MEREELVMAFTSAKRTASLSLGIGLALSGCFQDPPDCRLEECARLKYEIATLISDTLDPVGTRIDTLDTGQLHVLVQIQRTASLAKTSATAWTCISCEALFTHSSLTFSRPILAGPDTLAEGANLLDPDMIQKVGSGSPFSLLFNREVRFKPGANKLVFTSDLVWRDRKIGSVSLEKVLYVGERSSW